MVGLSRLSAVYIDDARRGIIRDGQLLRALLLGASLVITPIASAQSVCPGSVAPFAAGTNPAFEIDDLGTIRWLEDERGTVSSNGDLVFRVHIRAPASRLALRVDLVHAASPSTTVNLACGPVRDGQIVRIDGPDVDAGQRRLVRFSIFRQAVTDSERERFRASTEERERELRAEVAEAYLALHARAVVQDIAPQIAALATDRPGVIGYLTAIETRANVQSGRVYRCGAGRSGPEPFGRAVCDLNTRILGAVVQARGALQAGTPDLAAARQQMSALAELARVPLAVDEDATCGDVAELRWIRTAGRVRFITSIEAPWTDRRVLHAPYGHGERELEGAEPQDAGGLIMNDVPSDLTEVTFRQRVSATRLPNSFTVAISRFGSLLSSVRPPGLRSPPRPAACSGKARYRVSTGIPGLALAGTRAHVLLDIPDDRETFVDVCSGSACVSTGNAANVRDTIRLTPRPSCAFAALLELGVAPLSLQLAPVVESAYERQRYVAVGGTQGPEQLYRLENEQQIASLFSLTAMFAVTHRVSRDHRFLWAVGIVLFDGEGRRSFTEGALRIGIEVASNVFLTTGPSFASIARSVGAEEPDAVAVPRASPGAVPPPPSLSYGDAFVFRWSVGVSFDLAILGEAADAVADAIGGGS